MAEETTLFRAIDYIVELCRDTMASLQMDDVGVYDGPQTGQAGERVLILVAYNDEEGAPAVEGTVGTHEFGVPVEDYRIDCSISIEDGDIDLAAKRFEARQIFNALVGAVRADKKLGGLLVANGMAEISGFVYSQDQLTDGSGVVAAFSVNVREATIWNG
jgi:hypothetical protein